MPNATAWFVDHRTVARSPGKTACKHVHERDAHGQIDAVEDEERQPSLTAARTR